jgi:4a-hydroxytetrahydrobiopterin dehydratase
MTSELIERHLKAVSKWQQTGDAIQRVFDRGDFDGSIRFVDAIAVAANAANHHPDIGIAWNRVTVTLSTHDAGGLTEKDFALAAQIDDLSKAS